MFLLGEEKGDVLVHSGGVVRLCCFMGGIGLAPVLFLSFFFLFFLSFTAISTLCSFMSQVKKTLSKLH